MFLCRRVRNVIGIIRAEIQTLEGKRKKKGVAAIGLRQYTALISQKPKRSN